jgi:hypothetical protein
MTDEFNIDDLLNADTRSKDGVYFLWLTVLISAFFQLKRGDDYTAGARDFLFSDNNPFFDFVADGLGYEPEALRERITKALGRVI